MHTHTGKGGGGGKGGRTHTHKLPFGQCQCQRTAAAATASPANALLMDATASTRKPFKHLGQYAVVVVFVVVLHTATPTARVCKVKSLQFIWLPAKCRTDECNNCRSACGSNNHRNTHLNTEHTHLHAGKHTDTCSHTIYSGYCCCCCWANSMPFGGTANFRCLVIDINEVESESVSSNQQAYMQTIQLQITHTPCAPRGSLYLSVFVCESGR